MLGRFDSLQGEGRHLPEPPPYHLVEDQPGQQDVARQPRGALQVLLALLLLGRRLPALGQHPRAQPFPEPWIGPGQHAESVLGVGDGVFQCPLDPADEALVDGGRLEGAVPGKQIGEPFRERFPESPNGVPRPLPAHIVADGCIDHVGGPLDVALRVGDALDVGVEQDELANVPGEAVPDPVLGCLAQRVVDQIGVEGMIALGGVGHLDLAGQDGKIGVTPVQPEVVPPRGALDVLLDRRAAEGQVRPAIEDLRDPTGNLCGECAFVNWHMSGPECVG